MLKTIDDLLEEIKNNHVEVVFLDDDKDKREHDEEIERGIAEAKAIGCLQGNYKEGAL